MEESDKAKAAKQKQKKTLQKGDDKLFLLGNINANVNIFSQLSSMYQGQMEPEAGSETSTSTQATDIIPNQSFDAEINRIMLKINKKNETTKLKALQDLRAVLEKRDEEFLKSFFPTWIYIYKQFVNNEYDRKIIEESNQILSLQVVKLKKAIAPHLPNLFAHWFFCMNDPNSEISTVATRVFEQVFPQNKHSLVFFTYHKDILSQADFVFHLTPKKLIEENMNLEEVIADEIIERLIIEAFNSIIKGFELMKGAPQEGQYLDAVAGLFGLDEFQTTKSTLSVLQGNRKRPRIRSMVFEFISQLPKFFPKERLATNTVAFANLLLENLDDKERLVQRAIWRLALPSYLQLIDDEIWKKVDIFKKNENKLLNCIKACGYGIGADMYENLIVVFSFYGNNFNMENAKLKDYFNERVAIYKKFFEHLLAGFNHEEIKFFGDKLARCYYECAMFCIIKRIKPFIDAAAAAGNEGDHKNILNTSRALVNDVLTAPLNEFIRSNKPDNTMSPYKRIPDFFGDIIKMITFEPEISEKLFEDVEKTLRKQFKECLASISTFENYLVVLMNLTRVSKESSFYTIAKNMFNATYEGIEKDVRDSLLNPDVKTLSDDSIEKNFGGILRIEKLHTIVLENNAGLIAEVLPSLLQTSLELTGSLLKKYIDSVSNVMKLTSAESISAQIAKLLLQLLRASSGKGDLEKKLQPVFEIYLGLFEGDMIKARVDKNSLMLLILVSYLICPALPLRYFSDLNNVKANKKAEDNMLDKVAGSAKDVTPDTAIINSKTLQQIVLKYSKLAFRSDKLRILCPVLTLLLCGSVEEGVSQEILSDIVEFTLEVKNNPQKISLYIEKLDLSFKLVNFWMKKYSDPRTVRAKGGLNQTSVVFDQLKTLHLRLLDILNVLYASYSSHSRKISIIHGFIKKLDAITVEPFPVLSRALREYFLVLIRERIKEQFELHSPASADEKQFGALCKMTEEYLSIISGKKKIEVLTELTKLTLQPANFKDSMISHRIWVFLIILIRAAESLGVGYDQLFELKTEEDLKKEKFWFILDMLSLSTSNALIVHGKEKKTLLKVTNDVVLELLLKAVASKEKIPAVLEFLNYALEKSRENFLGYAHGIKTFLKSALSNYPDEEDLVPLLFDATISKPLNEILEMSKNLTNEGIEPLFKRVIVFKNIIPVFSKQVSAEIIKVKPITDQTLKNIQEMLGIMDSRRDKDENVAAVLVNLDVFCTFMVLNSKIDITDDLLDKTILFVFSKINKNTISSIVLNENFVLNTIFEFVNIIVEKRTFIPFTDHILDIQMLFEYGLESNKKMKKFASSALIKLNMFLRKVLPVLEMFAKGFKENVLNNMLELCLIKAKEVLQSQQVTLSDEKDILSNELSDSMITEFAETIGRITMAIDDNLSEGLIYKLFETEIAPIQKAAFTLLRHYYTTVKYKITKPIDVNKIDSKEYVEEVVRSHGVFPGTLLDYFTNFNPFDTIKPVEEEIKTIQDHKEEHKHGDESEDDDNDIEIELANNKNFGYLLAWICFILKIKRQLGTREETEILRKVLVQYLGDHKELYWKALNIVFLWLEELDLSLSEQKKIITPKSNEVSTLSPEWADFALNSEFFKLNVQFLYIFLSQFPTYFKKWLDNTSKTNISMAQSVIKTFISSTLFMDEIEIIETKQEDWQSEEFQIYFNKNTRQILAAYTKESAKLEISITIPDDYPLSLIQMEVVKGIKMPEMKMNRWLLLMRTILTNENNNFLAGLLMWKKNIDKEFEGIDECAICYYIIHASTRQLPTLACKTCKKKFHSACIHKWFETSNKSECPLCKSQFL